MLALSRKKGEALVINNNIEVTVLEVKGDQVKIGISAPKEVPIYRKEVYLQIQDSNKEAMQADLEALKKLFESLLTIRPKEPIYRNDKIGLDSYEKNREVLIWLLNRLEA